MTEKEKQLYLDLNWESRRSAGPELIVKILWEIQSELRGMRAELNRRKALTKGKRK